MSTRKHAKRRNSSLMFEFLTRKISEGLVNDDKKVSTKALKIVKKHFKQGSVLNSELKVASALLKTHSLSEHTAASIVNEARKAIRELDANELDNEKSRLIHDVNRTFDESLLDQHVESYRTHAMLQTLFNCWRSKNPNLTVLAECENSLMKHLVSEKPVVQEKVLLESSPGEARLLVNIMMRKINEKYSNSLSSRQKLLVREHVWSLTNDDKNKIVEHLENLKRDVSNSIDSFLAESNSHNLVEQLTAVKDRIMQENCKNVDDAMIARFMEYVKLDDEIKSNDKD